MAPHERLASITDREDFAIAKNTQRLLQQIAAREAKDVDGLLGIETGSVERKTILRRGESLPSASQPPLDGSSKSNKQAKARESDQKSGGRNSRSTKSATDAAGKAGTSTSRPPSGGTGSGESTRRPRAPQSERKGGLRWADLGRSSASTSPERANAIGATIPPRASSANEQKRRAGLAVSSTGTGNLNKKSSVLQVVLDEQEADMDISGDNKSTGKHKRRKRAEPQGGTSTKKASVAPPPGLRKKQQASKPQKWTQQLLYAYSTAHDRMVNK